MLALFPALFPATALGAPAACPTSTGSVTRTFTGGTAFTVTVPGASTTNNLANLTTTGTTGCLAADLSFSNFSVTSSGTNENAIPTAAGTYLSETPNADTLLFSTLQGAGTGGDGALNDGTDNTKVDNGETMTTTLSYGVSDSKGNVLGVDLTVNGITIAAGGSITAIIDTCAQGTGGHAPTAGNITTQAACNTAVGGIGIFTQSNGGTATSLATGQSQTIDLSLSSSSFVNVTQVFQFTGGSGTNETGFLTFGDNFTETPEPSTFVLLGSALAGAAALRLRKRA
jgi:hypothetical protein